MTPLNTPPPDLCRRAVRAVGASLLLTSAVGAISWGFVPHKRLHAKAWSLLPLDLQRAWHTGPAPLVLRATDADSRKHTDSLEAARHYLDVDDVEAEGLNVWGQPWHDAQQVLVSDSLGQSARRFGVLPWQLEWSYRRLVAAWSPTDSTMPNPEAISRAAADLGHYLADAHVPLHTSGNYDGQRTGQRGIHALWETHALEWMLSPSQRRSCPPCQLEEWTYDPVWTPWETLQESHSMATDVLNAELEWRALCAAQGHGFRRRGRTMTLLPTPEALAIWDSLTHGHTWPRYCRAAERIAAAWHSAWVDAGRPDLPRAPKRPWQERLALYLPPQWRAFLLPHPHDTPSPAPMDP